MVCASNAHWCTIKIQSTNKTANGIYIIKNPHVCILHISLQILSALLDPHFTRCMIHRPASLHFTKGYMPKLEMFSTDTSSIYPCKNYPLRHRSPTVYGHFGPKTVRHYIFGTEMSYFFVLVLKCLWDISALVPKCLGQIGGAFMFLYRFTTSCHICTVHRDLQTTWPTDPLSAQV